MSLLGGHEDAAHARLTFASGCVANLSASRVSYEPVRKMHVWAARAYANIDFAARTDDARAAQRGALAAASSMPSGFRRSKWSTTRRTWRKSTCRASR